MSKRQTDITDWQPTVDNHGDDEHGGPEWQRTTDDATSDGYGWTPDGSIDDVSDATDHPYRADVCQGCQEPLPERFRRVFGDNRNVVWECCYCPGQNREGMVEFANTAGTDRPTKTPNEVRNA